VSRTALCAMAVVVALVCLGLAGCGPAGPKTAPVKGTLTIDGKAADNIQITFAPVDSSLPTASGQVSNGSFELFTGAEGKKGAVPGKYKVVLAQMGGTSQEEMKAAYQAKTGRKSEAPAAPKATFPEKYKTPATSDKEVEVKPGSNEIKIEISGS